MNDVALQLSVKMSGETEVIGEKDFCRKYFPENLGTVQFDGHKWFVAFPEGKLTEIVQLPEELDYVELLTCESHWGRGETNNVNSWGYAIFIGPKSKIADVRLARDAAEVAQLALKELLPKSDSHYLRNVRCGVKS